MKKTLGGNRIGTGGKMEVELPEFPYSTHNLSYIKRTTAAPGVAIPIMKQVALPEDRWEIEIDAETLTNSTSGPCFGGFIQDVHVFKVPMRLYIGDLHMNLLEIGNDMSKVKIPQIKLSGKRITNPIDGIQINPSSIFAHLDIMGLGISTGGTDWLRREFNAIPFLAFYDIWKCYYANKQETNGYIIHTPVPTIQQTVTGVKYYESVDDTVGKILPTQGGGITSITVSPYSYLDFTYSGNMPNVADLYIQVDGKWYQCLALYGSYTISVANHIIFSQPPMDINYGNLTYWSYGQAVNNSGAQKVTLKSFEIRDIDKMRIELLKWSGQATPYIIDVLQPLEPWKSILAINTTDMRTSATMTMEGLPLVTYNSDVNNNWLKTTWVTSITTRSSINVSSGSLTMDALNFAKKFQQLLNAVALAGGTYDDWIETVWSSEKIQRAESPIYEGGLRKEIVFEEVVATTAQPATVGNVGQPLGQLGGRGKMGRMHKGGKISFKVDEPSYIIAIATIKPKIDYSQGNMWDVNLKTIDDLHKPQFDGIGFQDMILDERAWFSTTIDAGNVVYYKSGGKQPAWINYQTMVNQIRGNFAIENDQMFMVLARRYEFDPTLGIKDLSTYIDPSKYNYIFAETAIDSQNFWCHYGFDIKVRRKMSAKIIPNF